MGSMGTPADLRPSHHHRRLVGGVQLGELPEFVRAPDPTIYRRDDYVVVDFETTIRSKGSPLDPDNRIVLGCWRVGPDHVSAESLEREGSTARDRLCWGNEFSMDGLVQAINSASFVVAHNAKFELGWLKRCGIDLRRVIVFDTMMGDYVIGGNRYTMRQLSLNECLDRRELQGKDDTINLMFKAGIDTLDMPEEWLLKYCLRDVAACEELFLAQREDLRKLELEAVQYQRCLVMPVLADIEFNGMMLDSELVLKKEKAAEEEYEKLTRELQEFCEGASPSSPKQMQEFIYGTLGFAIPKDYKGKPLVTASGDASVKADVLERLVAKTDKQRQFLLLRNKWSVAHSDLTKYLRKFGDCAREDGGLLRASFNQTTTKTHRLSSNGLRQKVQFQNFNRLFKPLFKARHDGWVVGEIDGAQLEFRVAGHLGRDSVILKDISGKADIHKFTASIINGIPEARVTKAQRTAAKPHTFKPLYGGSSGTPAERAYYDAFKEKYSGIARAQLSWTQEVLKNKYLVTEWGLRYYWPDTRMSPSGYITNTTSIYNYPVQAFATAEIIPCALVAAWHRMKNMKGFLVNTVHDSIVAELPPEEVETWHEIGKQCLIHDVYVMIEGLYGVKLTVPLGAGVQVGDHWASVEAQKGETIYEAPEELWKPAAIAAKMIKEEA